MYGYLFPLRPQGPMIKLSADAFTVGRSAKNSHMVPEEGNKFYNNISKVHFIIRRETKGIFLQDKSTNGTFVNGKKVGKERSTVLVHNDVVGMTGEKLKDFIFMSTNREYLEKYPEALRARYTVSRELGKGACGTVYLAVRKSDHVTVAVKEINKKKVRCQTFEFYYSSPRSWER